MQTPTGKICPQCQQVTAPESAFCGRCGHAFSTQFPPQQTQAFYAPVQVPGMQDAASKKLAAGLLAIFLGGLGIHKFILGYNNAGVIMLVLSLVTCGVLYPVMHIIGIIEGIMYLTKTDQQFYAEYIAGRKEWF